MNASGTTTASRKPRRSSACARLQPTREVSQRITERALSLAREVRSTRPAALSAESFLRHYGLSTPEGVALMCVAEALLRIPDPETADALLREKLSAGPWAKGGQKAGARKLRIRGPRARPTGRSC